MPNYNKTENVVQQYSNDENLSIRISLHTKYSTNKKGFVSWLFEQYKFENNYRILELGCGNGSQWEGRIDELPDGCSLILSDFSEGMVDTVKRKYSQYENVSFEQLDIQSIGFPDKSFDVVIANHMLYHVPDLSKALSEVKRVLKTDAGFYSTTIGNGGMRSFLHNAFKHFNPDTKAFTQQWSFSLQNGFEILNRHFSNVERLDYEDSLAVTETEDLMDWIKSTISMASYSKNDIEGLFEYFENIRRINGAINISKEGGLFISKK